MINCSWKAIITVFSLWFLKVEVINKLEAERKSPCVIIEEQPSSNIRFRYESEKGSTSWITGANSTPKKKTKPTVKIENFNGHAVVVVSCVTKDAPHRWDLLIFTGISGKIEF